MIFVRNSTSLIRILGSPSFQQTPFYIFLVEDWAQKLKKIIYQPSS